MTNHVCFWDSNRDLQYNNYLYYKEASVFSMSHQEKDFDIMFFVLYGFHKDFLKSFSLSMDNSNSNIPEDVLEEANLALFSKKTR